MRKHEIQNIALKQLVSQGGLRKLREREIVERERERQERLEENNLALQHEIEMKRLDTQSKSGTDLCFASSGLRFDITKYIKFVPPFSRA